MNRLVTLCIASGSADESTDGIHDKKDPDPPIVIHTNRLQRFNRLGEEAVAGPLE